MNLQQKYQKEIIPAMMVKFSYKNSMAVPKIEKAVVNAGFGRLAVSLSGDEQKKSREAIFKDLSIICGQAPVFTRAKKSISSFKLRQGMVVGVKVTLRREKMYSFLERLINIALPRSRDFRGIDPKSVDEFGNLTIPILEQIIFPEVSAEQARRIFGFEVTVTTTAKTKEEGLELLRGMGFPIKRQI